jgi:hypothetical protein
MDITAQYDALWPQGASDPYELASAPEIQHTYGFHPAGGDGFLPWNKKNMLAAMQKLAKQREELLRQRAAAEQHVAQCDAELIALHEKANAFYNQIIKNVQTHKSRTSF